MSNTGYTDARAETHDRYIGIAIKWLEEQGHEPSELPVNGHRPDIQLKDGDYLDIKTSYAGQENLAIEVNSLQEYARIQVIEGNRVYIVHAMGAAISTWWVMLPESVDVIWGPKLATGNGSLDDWHLCKPGNIRGTRFDEFFAARVPTFDQGGLL